MIESSESSFERVLEHLNFARAFTSWSDFLDPYIQFVFARGSPSTTLRGSSLENAASFPPAISPCAEPNSSIHQPGWILDSQLRRRGSPCSRYRISPPIISCFRPRFARSLSRSAGVRVPCASRRSKGRWLCVCIGKAKRRPFFQQ